MSFDKSRTAIFDVDGTLFNTRPVAHLALNTLDFGPFMEAAVKCPPIPSVLELAHTLYDSGMAIVVLTARNRQYEGMTVESFASHGIRFHDLYMRPFGDQRPDRFVKHDLYHQILGDGYNPIVAIDDNPTIKELWDELGLFNHVVPGWNEGENPHDFDCSDQPYLSAAYTS